MGRAQRLLDWWQKWENVDQHQRKESYVPYIWQQEAVKRPKLGTIPFQALGGNIVELQINQKIGDWNGHMKWSPYGLATQGEDYQGKIIWEFNDRLGLHIMNGSNKCTGKWTWMKGNLKTVIDYVLIERDVTYKITGMKIDDHAWIEIQVNHQLKTTTSSNKLRNNELMNWNIGENTRWADYRINIEEKLLEWKQEWHRENGTETAHTDILEIAYNSLAAPIIIDTKDTIGLRPKNEGNVNKLKNFKLSKSILARNQAGKLWKRACKSNRTQTQALWRKFQKIKKIVTIKTRKIPAQY